MSTVLENINKLVGAKYELKSILQAVGADPTENAATYAYLFAWKLDEMKEEIDNIIGTE